MRGLPITRAASPDGRWHYTLYDGAGAHPFIHALDTVGRNAVCIDLHGIAGRQDLYDLRLGLRGRRGLAVLAAGEPLALVDRATFRVRRPGDGAGGGGAGTGGSEPGRSSRSPACRPWPPARRSRSCGAGERAGRDRARRRVRFRPPDLFAPRHLSRPRDGSRRRDRSRPRDLRGRVARMRRCGGVAVPARR